MRIVGFCGYARSGKDTAARGLVADGWRRAAFADALKQDILHAMITASEKARLPRDAWPQWRWFEDGQKKEIFRPLLVEYGRAMRKVCPEYWIRRLESDYVKGLGCFAVTDVRYANEAEWIRAKGGLVLRVARAGVGPANDEEKNSLAAFEPDLTLVNCGTPEDLQAQVAAAVVRHFGVCP